MFVYEPYRKRALDLDNNKKEEQEEPPIQRGRIKKTQRVIRMFQVTHKHTQKKGFKFLLYFRSVQKRASQGNKSL